MNIWFSSVMQKESRWRHRSVLTRMQVHRVWQPEAAHMQRLLTMDGIQTTLWQDRQWRQCLHIWERNSAENNCYISNWILGNEVNSASGYYYVGNVSFSKFISMYSEAFRCLYNAVRSSRGSSKVFICLDNCWNQKNAFSVCYSAKSTLDNFATKILRCRRMLTGIWHIMLIINAFRSSVLVWGKCIYVYQRCQFHNIHYNEKYWHID